MANQTLFLRAKERLLVPTLIVTQKEDLYLSPTIRMKKFFLLLLCLPTLIQANAQDEVSGKVVAVVDGNTLEVLTGTNETYKIVLAGIDSPELTQEYGDKAKQFLEKLAGEKEVTFVLKGKDRWGNYLGRVLLDGETDLRIELLREGLAWTSEKNPQPELESYRTTAQEKGKGLWKQDNPIPPWIYRRQQSMMVAKSR